MNMYPYNSDMYKKVNDSFKEKMIYRLGYDAGFFSEYNNMILASIYCLSNEISFYINSNFSNFKVYEGWQDYFIPFFPENKKNYNKKYNYRPFGYKNKFYKFIKVFNRVDFFTQDLWFDIRSEVFFTNEIIIPQFNFRGTLLEACNILVPLTWNFKPEIAKQIQFQKEQLNLPKEYIGLHIRRGDKLIETSQFYNLSEYLDVAEKNSTIRNIFISTDDYRVIEELKNNNKWNVFHLASINSQGYFQQQFDKKLPFEKYNDLIDLFSNVQILYNSSTFIGTCKSNIGMFIGMYRNNQNCHYLDTNTWRAF